jgi:hypothetical protein
MVERASQIFLFRHYLFPLHHLHHIKLLPCDHYPVGRRFRRRPPEGSGEDRVRYRARGRGIKWEIASMGLEAI